jgi:ATP-dependent Lon protease
MVVALASLLTGRKVRSDAAMTGEITLRGKVLPVGGIKEKVLAAHRAGIRTVLLPKLNEKDLEELPESVRKEMAFFLVDNIGDAVKAALEKPTKVPSSKKKPVRKEPAKNASAKKTPAKKTAPKKKTAKKKTVKKRAPQRTKAKGKRTKG